MKIFKFNKFINEDLDFDSDDKEITEDDIIDVIENDGVIYTNIVDNYPDHSEDEPLNPISIDNDEIIVDIDGELHTVDLSFIKKYEI